MLGDFHPAVERLFAAVVVAVVEGSCRYHHCWMFVVVLVHLIPIVVDHLDLVLEDCWFYEYCQG